MSTTYGAAVSADRTCYGVMTTHRHTTMKGRVKVTVLVPAHNEAQDIGTTIKSIQGQSRPPDEIVVMCDNCTDNTAEVATGHGVRVLNSVKNQGRKAGAMNQALRVILSDLDDDDLVVCMDADTIIEHDMIRNAESLFWRQPRLGAVSSNHLIEYKRTPIELLQAMEYERDRRMIGRRKGRYGCMTGMAAMYRVQAMRDVVAAYGSVYDDTNWTEDWKLTIALKTSSTGIWYVRRIAWPPRSLCRPSRACSFSGNDGRAAISRR